MATTVQPQAGQPVYLPPGTAPPMQPNPAAPAAGAGVMYYPPGTAGVPQGAVIMVFRYTHTQSQSNVCVFIGVKLLLLGD
jgi:hypothetical protein